jgi:hypothetical protein
MERITHLGDTIRPVGDVERSIGLLEMDWQRFRIGRRLRSLRVQRIQREKIFPLNLNTVTKTSISNLDTEIKMRCSLTLQAKHR